MLKRLVGLVIVLIGLAGIALSLGGIIWVQRMSDRPPALVESRLILLEDSLTTISDTAETTAQGLSTVSDSLLNLQGITLRWTDVVSNTYPSLDAADGLITEDVPDRIRAIQDSLPALQQTAGVVDQTLIRLTQLQSLLANLGLVSTPSIFYNPDKLLSAAVGEFGTSLQGLPERLESVDPNLELVRQQLVVVEDTILAVNATNKAVSDDLERLVENVKRFEELMGELEEVPGDLRSDLTRLTRAAKPVVTLVLAWLGFSQLVPLYVGLQAFLGRTGDRPAGPAGG
jgi:prefoldin subunit 5